MSKKDDTLHVQPGTDLAKREAGGMTVAGSFMPEDFATLIGEGFASIDTVMLGDPEDGKLPFYMGQLVGPGEPIRINDSESEMPTWAFHPITRTADGRIGIAANITHIVPASYMVNAACSRIYKEAERKHAIATVGVMYGGQGKTKTGRALNQYRIFEKYDALLPIPPASGR